jgi:hypothetical protein
MKDVTCNSWGGAAAPPYRAWGRRGSAALPGMGRRGSAALPGNYEQTLSVVRELSENAMLRPAPRVLHWRPWKPFELRPLPASRNISFIQRVREEMRAVDNLQPSTCNL